MVEDNLHGFLHDDVVLRSEPLHRWVGWWSLPFKVFGQNQSILFGEQALLFEQFPNGFQLVHIVDGHFAEIEKSLPVFGIRHIGSLWGR